MANLSLDLLEQMRIMMEDPAFSDSYLQKIPWHKELLSGLPGKSELLDDWKEWGGRSGPRVAAIYETARYPAATIKIFCEGLDKNDPRNPNPAAGPTRIWIVKCGDRKIGPPFRALGAAKMKAKTLHDKMVAELDGQAAEAQLEELEQLAKHDLYQRF